MLYIFFVDVFDILCQLPSGNRACQVIRIIHWTSQKFRNIYQACNNPRNIHRACKKSRRLHPAILIVKYVAWILYRNNSVEVIIRTSAVFTKHFDISGVSQKLDVVFSRISPGSLSVFFYLVQIIEDILWWCPWWPNNKGS